MSSRVGGGEGNDERCKRVDLSLGKALNEVTDRGQADFRVSAWVKRGGRKGGGEKDARKRTRGDGRQHHE